MRGGPARPSRRWACRSRSMARASRWTACRSPIFGEADGSPKPMRIATWNVNSLSARLEKVEWWLDRAAPDVLLLQETKLSDGDAPLMAFQMAGYQLLHHGEGRWNGVAVAVRDGIAFDEHVTNFGDGPVRNS